MTASTVQKSRQKVLFVTETIPYPPVTGSKQRTDILLRGLAEFADVDIFVLGGHQERDNLEKAGYSVAGNCLVPDKGKLENALRAIFPLRDYRPQDKVVKEIQKIFETGNYDLLVGRYVRPTLKSGLSAIGPAIVDIDDVDTSALKSRIESEHTPWWLRLVLRYRLKVLQNEYDALLAPYKGVLVTNEKDAALLKHDNIQVVPNIPYNSPDPADIQRSDSNTALWVGSFNYNVNLEGLDDFISNDWKKIVESVPQARLRVVGSRLPEPFSQKWKQEPNIDIAGFVENLGEEYRNASFSVVPLWDGAGTKIKVLESLMFGRTAVVTKHSAHGFEQLRGSGAFLIAASKEDFVEKAVRLLKDVNLRHEMEVKGLNMAQEHFSYSCVKIAVKQLIESI